MTPPVPSDAARLAPCRSAIAAALALLDVPLSGASDAAIDDLHVVRAYLIDALQASLTYH